MKDGSCDVQYVELAILHVQQFKLHARELAVLLELQLCRLRLLQPPLQLRRLGPRSRQFVLKPRGACFHLRDRWLLDHGSPCTRYSMLDARPLPARAHAAPAVSLGVRAAHQSRVLF